MSGVFIKGFAWANEIFVRWRVVDPGDIGDNGRGVFDHTFDRTFE